MSLIDTIRSWFGGGGPTGVYLVDAAGLSSQSGDRMGPRDQVQLLDRLARFAKHERVHICAVLDGKPLREVDDGGEYKDVRVYFTKKEMSSSDLMLKLLKGRMRNATALVITADTAVEEQARNMGKSVMRGATLRRAMEAAGGPAAGGDRGGEGRSSSQRRRGGRRSRRKGGRGGDGEGRSPRGAPSGSDAPSAQNEGSGSTDAAPKDQAVRNLIDLVD